MFNIATILCALLLAPLMPRIGWPPITAIAIGALVGGVAQVAVQWPLLRGEGFSYAPLLNWKQEGLQRVLMLMGPGTIGLAATQVNVFVNTVLATSEGTGAVSWLNYAFRLMYLPTGLFGVSIATATVPAVSRHAARDDAAAVRSTLGEGLSLMFVMNVPATIGLIVLAHPIIRVIFERRAFLPSDTAATAAALQFYAIGLLGYSIVRIASPTFYALGDSRTPVQVSIAAVVLNAVLNVVLARVLGYRGLALGTSIAALFNAGGLLWLLRARLGGLDDRRVLSSLARVAIASVVMGTVAIGINGMLETWVAGDTFARQATRLLLTIASALLVLAGSAHILRIREFREALALVATRLRASASAGPPVGPHPRSD
jgi:putative peptidoglycan lipid II flippase